MKRIIINDHELTEEDLEMEVIRVKGLILNSQGKVLLVHNNNTYQFPGGHLEENETMNECIIREIEDETGISLTVEENPFLCIETFDNDYFGTNKKVLNRIYYYRFFTNQEPDLSKTHYDELELETDFNLFYINFEQLEDFIKEQTISKKMDEKISREMLLVLKEYHQLFGKDR